MTTNLGCVVSHSALARVLFISVVRLVPTERSSIRPVDGDGYRSERTEAKPTADEPIWASALGTYLAGAECEDSRTATSSRPTR